MTWDDILIEKKIFDKLSYIIPAVLVIFAVPSILQKYPTLNYIVTAAMIVILLVIIWTIIALLSVFDDILSKSPVLRASQLRVIFKYSILRCIS
jgi:miniconductance mechanosensitive channel